MSKSMCSWCRSRLWSVTGACLLALTPLVTSAKPATRIRSEIPDVYKWDVSAIYPSWAAWEADLKVLEAKIEAFSALQGTLSSGPAALLKAFQMSDEMGQLRYKLYCYPSLQRDTDTRDTEISGKFQRVLALFAKQGTANAWFTPELLTIPEGTAMEWINAEPALQPYRFSITETYRQAEHVLDEKGERIMSFASQFNGTPRSIYQELSTSDVQFPTVTLSDGKSVKVSYGGYSEVLTTARVQADRAAAFKAHYETYAANKNTYAAIYNGILQRDWFRAQARHYPSTLAAALDSDNVPESVYKTLVETVRAGTGPIRRYMQLRQKMLGLETYHLYDGSLPLLADDRTYPYDDMKALVLASVKPLGADYQAKMNQLVNGRWLDVYENDGKRSGAYSMGVYGVGPFMLMNYNDTLDAVFTFAHEAGHSMHSVLSFETQPFDTASYTIFVAEVASTTNERFMLEELLGRTSDPKERFLLLQHAIDNIAGTFYTQVLFADYEWQAHQLVENGQPVTPDTLSGIYAGLLDTYYGDAVAKDELYRYTWTRISHFFNSPYYVYKYATCFASSAQLFKAMTSGPLDEQLAARERYLTLLRSGGSDQPMELLRRAGVDLNRRETIQAVVDQMDELVTRLEAEAAKIRTKS